MDRHGNVRFWPISEVATSLIEVRLVGRSGLDLLTLSSSPFDPEQTQPSPMQGIRVVSMTRTRCGYACGAR
jgi:hypothetical protein